MPAKTHTRSFATRLNHLLQAVAAYVVFALVRLMPLDMASAIGGWLGRTVGPHLRVTDVARDNLRHALPEKTSGEIEIIVRAMWDNFGRVAFEFPLLHRMSFDGPGARVEIVGSEHIEQLRDDGKPGIFVSGHFANWELAGRSVITCGVPLNLIYRLPNNPLTIDLLMHRNPGQGEMIPKGARGAKRMLQLLKQGQHLGIMADQKLNDGIAVPFFGRDAMTATAMGQLALRFECPVAPIRVERMNGAHFRVTCLPPMMVEDTGDKHADIRTFTIKINELLEDWIRDRPEQWLWLHHRWPRSD